MHIETLWAPLSIVGFYFFKLLTFRGNLLQITTLLANTVKKKGSTYNKNGNLQFLIPCCLLSNKYIIASSHLIASPPHFSSFVFSLVSSDYLAFQEAAEQFQPFIKFFATFEKSVSIMLFYALFMFRRSLSLCDYFSFWEAVILWKQLMVDELLLFLHCRWQKSWLWRWMRWTSMSPSWRNQSPFQTNLTQRKSWWPSYLNTGGNQES